MNLKRQLQERRRRMTKKLFVVTSTYGKGEGEEETDRQVLEDTAENRAKMVEDNFWYESDVYESIEDFVNGNKDSIYGDLIGGDWDEPTGITITVQTKAEALSELETAYRKNVRAISRLFKREGKQDEQS